MHSTAHFNLDPIDRRHAQSDGAAQDQDEADGGISSAEFARAALISQRMTRPVAPSVDGRSARASSGPVGAVAASSAVQALFRRSQLPVDEPSLTTMYMETNTPLMSRRGAGDLMLSTPTATTTATARSTPASPAGSAIPLWHPPTTAMSSRDSLKKRSPRDLLEEDRSSLPTMESERFTLKDRTSSSIEPTELARLDSDADPEHVDVYFGAHSPALFSSRLTQIPASTRGTLSGVTDPLNTMLSKRRTSKEPDGMMLHQSTLVTEVGALPAPLFHHPDHASKDPRQDTSHSVRFKTRSSMLDPPSLVGELVTDAPPPHVTIEETQKYTFAIVLRHTEEVFTLMRRRFPSKSAASLRRDLAAHVSQLQQKCVRRLVQAGLGVVVLENDIYLDDGAADDDEEQAGKNICILVDPKRDPTLLLHEFKREMDELAIQQGDGTSRMAEESLDSIKGMCFSPALELQLTHNIIQNAFKDYEKEEWLVDINRELTVRDMIKECFPLHDRVFNNKFFAEFRKHTFEFRLRKTTSGNSDRWAVEELRLHFGERVAFLFAFMHIYTKHLLPITMFCVCYYLSFRFLSKPVWAQYLEGLSVLGFGVACFWGPAFLICWERETRLLVEKWNLTKYKNTVYEKNDSNPSFQYVWVKNELTCEMEKVPKQRKNHWIQVTMLFYVLLSAIIQCLFLVPFVQWYVYAKNAPQCTKCRADDNGDYDVCLWFVTCFESETSLLGTDRWFYILIQGVLLGLLIDIIFFEVFNWVSEKFVKWENYAKKSDYENRLIHRRFVFVWSNWFFWFLFIAFVYLPFGNRFLEYFRNVGLGILAPYEWDPTKLTLDTLFVTPLVVTQFLNLLLETIVPYLMRKLRGRPSTCRRTSPIAWCMQKIRRRVKTGASINMSMSQQNQRREREGGNQPLTLTAKRLARLVEQRTGFKVEVMPCSDDCNQYSAYEIIAESKLAVFDPMLDYLDACIQFSYVIMFTVVWPLLPFPAFFNNVLEVRGDAFRLLFAQRRPMPRRDTSIGEWMTVLSYANIIGITVVMGFIVVYQWGYFVTDCNFHFADGNMVPFSTIDLSLVVNRQACENKSGTSHWTMIQIVLFVILEHLGFCFRYLVIQVDKTPAAIRSSGYQRLKQIHSLTSTRSAHAAQFEYMQKLKTVFDRYDEEHTGHLREPDLVAFLADWICKHPSELLPYSSIIFRYMDKNGLGKIPFSTCCLMLQHVNHDRFFSCLLGLYDPINGEMNNDIRGVEGGMELRRVMSEVSSVVSHRRSSVASMVSAGDAAGRPRDSSFFYMN